MIREERIERVEVEVPVMIVALRVGDQPSSHSHNVDIKHAKSNGLNIATIATATIAKNRS